MLKKIFFFEKEKHPYLNKLWECFKSFLIKVYSIFHACLSNKLDLRGLWQWYYVAWGQSFLLDGRTSRAPFFAYILINLLIYQLLRLVFLLLNIDPAIALIIPFITVFPLFVLYIRRFHDRSHSTAFALVPFAFLICLIPFGLFQAVVDMFQFQSMFPWQRFFNQSTLIIMLVCEFFATLCLWLVFLSMPSKQENNKYGPVSQPASDDFVLTCEVILIVIMGLSALFHGLFYLKKMPTTHFNPVTHQVDTLFQQPVVSTPMVIGEPVIETNEIKTTQDYKASHEKHKNIIEKVSLKWVPTQPKTDNLPLFSDEIPNKDRSEPLSDILEGLLTQQPEQKNSTQTNKSLDEKQHKTFLSKFIDDLFHNRPVTIETNIFKQKKQRFIPNPFLTKKPQDFVVKEKEVTVKKQKNIQKNNQLTSQKEVLLTYPQKSEVLNKKMNQELIADIESDVTIFNTTKLEGEGEKLQKKKALQQKVAHLKKSNEIMQFLYDTAINSSQIEKLPDTISQIKRQKNGLFIFILKQEDLAPYLNKNNVHCVKTKCTFNIEDLL